MTYYLHEIPEIRYKNYVRVSQESGWQTYNIHNKSWIPMIFTDERLRLFSTFSKRELSHIEVIVLGLDG